MRLKNFLSLIALSIPSFIFAAPSDYGRPWDVPGYHSSGSGKLFLVILIIAFIYYVVKSKPKKK